MSTNFIPDTRSETELAEIKSRARKAASVQRKQAKEAAGENAISNLASRILDCLNPVAGRVVSGFLPIGSEIDPRPALEKLRAAGCQICLPCVVGDAQPLVFRLWQQGDPLVKESFGTVAPSPEAPAVDPDILLVPMLAYDRAGYRLGYGGGFYDRSLEALRAKKTVEAVGIAYAGQLVAEVPIGPFDQPLDWVITDQGGFQPGEPG